MTQAAELMQGLGATAVSQGGAPFLERKLLRLARKARISTPALYIMKDSRPNACAIGFSEADSAVAVTSGLLTCLDESQIEAVLAHEVGHIQKGHSIAKTKVAMKALTIAGGGALVAGELALSDLDFTPGDDDPDDLASVFLRLCLAGAVQAVSTGIASHVLSAKAFETEFEADEAGAELSGKGWALASALQVIEELSKAGGKTYAPEVSQLFIVSPEYLEHQTHPPTGDRIDRLMAEPSRIPEVPVIGTRFCSSCGEKSDTDGKHCYWCGVQLD